MSTKKVLGTPVEIPTEPPPPPPRPNRREGFGPVPFPPYRAPMPTPPLRDRISQEWPPPRVTSEYVQPPPASTGRSGAFRLEIPAKGLATVIVAIIGAGGGGAVVSEVLKRPDSDRIARIEHLTTFGDADRKWSKECLLKLSAYLAEQSDYEQRRDDLQQALNCKAGVVAFGMKCNSVEFQSPPVCTRGKICGSVWKTETEWPRPPKFHGCTP